jgi:hypothetical protein
MLRDWLRVKKFVERELPRGPGVVCVDLDSVLIYHSTEWHDSHMGRMLPFGMKLCKLLKQCGKTIVVLTARPVDQHHVLLEFLLYHKFPIERVTNIKPPAQAYFDDRAVRIPKNWK